MGRWNRRRFPARGLQGRTLSDDDQDGVLGFGAIGMHLIGS
jgi:phosphoglycerate dehydrogenase-like enzyme